MSLRTSFRGLTSSLRSLSTTSRLSNTATPPAQSEHSPEFDQLNALLSQTASTSTLFNEVPAASTSSSTATSAPVIVNPDAARGYTAQSLPPDVDPLLALFTNLLMKHGRKAEAEGRVSRILSLIQGATNQNPRPLFEQAVTLSSPSIRVVSSRARAKTTQTPLALTERQRTRQGIMWILKAAEKGRKGGIPRETRIAREVLAVLEGNSDVFKWLEEKHKVATANRSNLNFRR